MKVPMDKKVIKTMMIILVCSLLSYFTVIWFLPQSDLSPCNPCNGTGRVDAPVISKIEQSTMQLVFCDFCGGDGNIEVPKDNTMYFVLFFVIYLMSLGVVTGHMKKFTLKIGPLILAKESNTNIIRAEETKSEKETKNEENKEA